MMSLTATLALGGLCLVNYLLDSRFSQLEETLLLTIYSYLS